ncbi:MAG: CorA family divalent cation transporter [Pirellulaceae bacterium]|nr:CorA family divalent cation transporter [Pirellulaceae bacterium]MDP7015324.1 CorA family divalent cation transporter [Pirellulaceae bacterium]
MESRSILPASWDVPEEFRDRLGETVGRQRVMVADGHLLLVLHASPHPDDETRKGRFFWRQADGEWKGSELGGGVGAVMKHLREYRESLHEHDDHVENAQTASDYFDVLEAVSPIHRAASHQLQVFEEARKTVREDRDLINLRDLAYEIERTSDLLYAAARNGMEFAVARRAEEQAQVSHRMAISAHRLNVLAAFFFPIATLSAIFGVNLIHGLEQQKGPFPFLGMVGIGLVTGALLTFFITRKSPESQN